MSWQDNLNTDFIIKTGDGIEYKPKWKNAVKSVDYNLTIFEFINVQGSLVRRQKEKGRRFQLEFYFDGPNHLEFANNFEISSRNKNTWKVTHPYYGDIVCQPLGLTQDNKVDNVTKFTCVVMETLGEGFPDVEEVASDNIINLIDVINEEQATVFATANEFDRNDLKEITESLDETYSTVIDDPDELNEFKALVSEAVTTIDDVQEEALNIIRGIQNVINYPATITQTVEQRYAVLKESFTNLVSSTEGILAGARSLSLKYQYEAIGGSIIASMQIASITEPDYNIRSSVIDQQIDLLDQYNSYTGLLDENQTDRADEPTSYQPDYISMNSISEIVNSTIANLFVIAFATKQERTYTLPKDSNIILLVHKFYSLDENDENLSNFIETNNIGLNEMLNIKKGRNIIYYI